MPRIGWNWTAPITVEYKSLSVEEWEGFAAAWMLSETIDFDGLTLWVRNIVEADGVRFFACDIAQEDTKNTQKNQNTRKSGENTGISRKKSAISCKSPRREEKS